VPHLLQFPPAPTVVPIPGGRSYGPDPATADAAGRIIPGPAAWPYTGGIPLPLTASGAFRP
jgi:hypothetical protein